MDRKESVPAYQYGTSAPADDGAEVHLVRPYSPETHFKGLDRDGDGVLSLSEFLAERQGAEAIRKGTDVFAILDQDHDGKLTLAEFTNRPPRAQFRELDDDGDGYLNFKEFWRGTMSSASQKQVERTFRALDKDHDNRISFDEFINRPAEGWFFPIDQDEDGFISFDEFARAHPNLVENGHCQAAFEFMDKNHDGKLSVEEFAAGLASPEVTFYKQDKNRDGKLSFEEFSEGANTAEARAAAKRDFEQKDIDGDGLLTLEEYKMPPQQARFRKLDRNHDGFLSLEEFCAGTSGKEAKRARRIFAAKDTNGDKRLDFAEFSARPPAVGFIELDTDGDGFLDFKEFWRGTMGWASQRHAERTFRAVDQDHDGKISFREFVGRTAEGWLLPMDRDEDGFLSLEEFAQGHPDLVMSKHCRAAFAFMDKNHDGKLSVEEFTAGLASPEVTFYKQDKDGDGSLTLAEFSVWAATPEARAAAKRDFEQKDIDGDGRLTLEEFKTPPEQAQFRKLDRNHDGFLTVAEFCAGTSGKEAAKARRIFAAKDTNGDKRLDLAEFSARPPAVDFIERDTDGDGFLSLAEYLGDKKDPAAVRVEKDVFAILDSNHDGKLTPEEFQSHPFEVTFRRMDLNGDGVLDFAEFHQGDMKGASVARAQRAFAAIDRNHDGKISLEEFLNCPDEAWFHRMDAAETGWLTVEEYTNSDGTLVRNKTGQRAFNVMDRNGDGKLDLAEYCHPYDEVAFLKLDANGDGVLSFEEYAKWCYTPEARAAAKKDFARRGHRRRWRPELQGVCLSGGGQGFLGNGQEGRLPRDAG